MAGRSECSSGQCRGWQVAVAFLWHREGFWLARWSGRHTVHVWSGTGGSYWGLCTHAITVPSMAVFHMNLIKPVSCLNCIMPAAILKKNWKIMISQQLFDWFWQNLAWWCISVLWTLQPLRFPESGKIAISLQLLYRFWWTLVRWCTGTPRRYRPLRFQKLKSRWPLATILQNGKIAVSLQPLDWFRWNLA